MGSLQTATTRETRARRAAVEHARGRRGVPRPPVPVAARDLLNGAAHGLQEAGHAVQIPQRYALAHLAALRAAAAVLAARAQAPMGRSRVRSVWALLPDVAPELAEWSAYFAAGAGKRAAAEAGLSRAVTAREADDLLRAAETFLALVDTTLGVDRYPARPDWPVERVDAGVQLRPVG